MGLEIIDDLMVGVLVFWFLFLTTLKENSVKQCNYLLTNCKVCGLESMLKLFVIANGTNIITVE